MTFSAVWVRSDFLRSRSRLLWVTLALSLAATVSGCAATPTKQELSDDQRAHLLIDAANGALREGDATGALQLLVDAERTLPDSAALHHSMAIAYYAKSDPKKAIIEARKAVRLEPKYSAAKITLGKMLLDASDFAGAEPVLHEAAVDSLNRDAYKAYTLLGLLHYRQNQWTLASENFERAVTESPQLSCVAHYYLGHLRLRRANFGEAVREYAAATTKFCGTFADAHLALGIAYEKAQRYTEARKKFLDIKQNFPNTKVADQAMDRLKYLP